jgi:hypothetical protein
MQRLSVFLPSLLGSAAIALLLYSAVPLTQSDGDLFAHIAFGRDILRHGLSAPVSPAWGSAVLLAWLHALGGLPAIVCVVAVMAGLAHALVTHLLLRSGVAPLTALLGGVVSVALASSHWLARPHAATLLLLAILMLLLRGRDARTIRWLIPLFAIWANLHGGWTFGLMVLVSHTIGEVIAPRQQHSHRQRSTILIAVTGLACVATLATPYGIALQRTILHTLQDGALAATVTEYQPPALTSPVDVLFLLIALGALPILIATRAAWSLSTTLIVLLSIVVSLRASRNIALFAFTGWPLLVMQAARRHPTPSVPSVGNLTITQTVWWPGGLVAAGVLLLGAQGGQLWQREMLAVPIDATRFPVAAVDALQQAPPPGHVLTTWAWSGYLPYAWRGHQAWFDPLHFTPERMQQLGTLLTLRAGWRGLLDRAAIGTVLMPRRSALALALADDHAWDCWYHDRTATICRRRSAPDHL